MPKPFSLLLAAALLALAVTGCESTGSIAARTREKSAVYAPLKPWEKKYLERGSVAIGFTPDMVYIALGRPSKIAARDFPEGRAELWTYARVYPSADAVRGFKHVNLTVESAYQSAPPTGAVPPPNPANLRNTLGEKPPVTPESGSGIHKTGGPQGVSMEPVDLSSQTIQVLFENGEVARLSVIPTTN